MFLCNKLIRLSYLQMYINIPYTWEILDHRTVLPVPINQFTAQASTAILIITPDDVQSMLLSTADMTSNEIE